LTAKKKVLKKLHNILGKNFFSKLIEKLVDLFEHMKNYELQIAIPFDEKFFALVSLDIFSNFYEYIIDISHITHVYVTAMKV
jgi:hypothetical protein